MNRTSVWMAAVAVVIAAPVQAHQPNSDRTATAKFAAINKIERDFAAMSVAEGLRKSFLAYVAPDGIIFRPTAVPAVATLEKDPDNEPGEVLDWWPVAGAISRSQDLALSLGPWTYDSPGPEKRRLYGYYATIWRKQPDGSWKFVVDGAGGRIPAAPARAKGSPVTLMPVSIAGPDVGAGQALAEVRTAEEALSAATASDAQAAIRSRLAPGAWLLGGGQIEPGPTKSATEAELNRRPAKLRLSYQGGGASKAGDLAYTYGAVKSDDPGRPLEDASYIHVWQRQREGWRIIFQGIKGAG